MTTEADPIRERLRPRIVETGETGRLDLGLPVIPEPGSQPSPTRRFPSPFAVAMAGLGILAVGVIAIDLVQFVDGAFAHGTSVGVLATLAVAAGAGGALYWLMAELRGLWRLRSAERLRRLIPSALAGELKQEINAAAVILARDPLLHNAVHTYRSALEPHHTGKDALELFSRFVLTPADQLAQAAIRRAVGAGLRNQRDQPHGIARHASVCCTGDAPHPRGGGDLRSTSRACRHRPFATPARQGRRAGRRR